MEPKFKVGQELQIEGTHPVTLEYQQSGKVVIVQVNLVDGEYIYTVCPKDSTSKSDFYNIKLFNRK